MTRGREERINHSFIVAHAAASVEAPALSAQQTRRTLTMQQPWRRLLVLFSLLAIVAVAHGVDEPAAEVPEPAAEGEEEVEVESAAAAAGEEAEAEALPAAEEEEVAVEEEAATARAGAASVQWVVTAKMKAQLTKLGYSSAEIGQLDAERAAAIIRRSISRPSKGVPAGWNRGAKRPAVLGLSRSLLASARKITSALPGGPAGPAVALVGVVGAVAFGRGGGEIVQRAPVPMPVEEEAVIEEASDELWLDRQIDKLIAFLKVLLGK